MDYIRPHPNPPLSKGRVPLGGWGYLSQTLFELVLQLPKNHKNRSKATALERLSRYFTCLKKLETKGSSECANDHIIIVTIMVRRS